MTLESANDLHEFESGRSAVQRVLMSNQIADVLRNEILFGRLRSGTRLAQQQLCERFGTSRMPVRDALRQLISEGMLIVDQTQHTVVAQLAKSDITDSFLIEGMLHGLAMRRMVERATPAELEYLEQLHQRMIEAGDANDPSAMVELNWLFHRTINRRAGSRKLIAALRSVSIDIPRDYLLHFPDRIKNTNIEHGEVMDRVRRRDAKGAERLMAAHIRSSGQGLIDYLEAQNVDFGE